MPDAQDVRQMIERSIEPRQSGILLSVTSLPSIHGIGDLGPAAYAFVDLLSGAKQRFWQMLPLSPTALSTSNSPYLSDSAFALNPLLVSLEKLAQMGLLTAQEIDAYRPVNQEFVDYKAVSDFKGRLLKSAYQRFKSAAERDDFVAFKISNAAWLVDYAMFRVIKENNQQKAWYQWNEGLRDRDETILSVYRDIYQDSINEVMFVQFILHKQMQELKAYAAQNSVRFIGDVPMYVSHDSADVWSNRRYFDLTEDNNLRYAAGVPPDAFSVTGQVWGNPVYRWDALRENQYSWWVARLKQQLLYFDMIRLDHFRGFAGYWAVPVSAIDATEGHWITGPGSDFIARLKIEFPQMPFIAEDLGQITGDVKALLSESGLPGMNVLQFGFEGDHRYHPNEHIENSVVYTGTHDNNTTNGWLAREAGLQQKSEITQYAASKNITGMVHEQFIQMALSSPSRIAIVPLQDVLGLGEEARMNMPGTTVHNWSWRVRSDAIHAQALDVIRRATEDYRGKDMNHLDVLTVHSPSVLTAIRYLIDAGEKSLSVQLDAMARNGLIRVAAVKGFLATVYHSGIQEYLILSNHPEYAQRGLLTSTQIAASLIHEVGALGAFNLTHEENTRREEDFLRNDVQANLVRMALQPEALNETLAAAEEGRIRLNQNVVSVLKILKGVQFGDLDKLLFIHEGSHHQTYGKLGAHLIRHQQVTYGTYFAVWAPNARSVSVIGDFNGWNRNDGRMTKDLITGVWSVYVPEVNEGDLYKFSVEGLDNVTRIKADPYAFFSEFPTGTNPERTASIVWDTEKFNWSDDQWMQSRADAQSLNAPISVYELHLGSFRNKLDENGALVPLTYRDLAAELIPYLQDMKYTHVEFMPPYEHSYYPSWGYQVSNYFSPTSRYGTPDDLKYLIDSLHQAGFGVFFDWVPAHFPRDGHGLVRFDGTELYSHELPVQSDHPHWGTLVFNYGRNEVLSFLVSNAMYWFKYYHIDGIRVDAVSSMLYLDYGREAGQWIPNIYGGRENLEAIRFLRQLNDTAHQQYPGILTIAEESTDWPGITSPTISNEKALGFDLKWAMGWMNDTLQYFRQPTIFRQYHHRNITFFNMYAFSERFALALSHDEVVHGKGSLIGKMPGDEWQRFANLRLLFSLMFTTPGKKLMFMGGELAQTSEWNPDRGLDWHLLQYPLHQGVQRLVRQLNALYKNEQNLFRFDHSRDGFEVVDYDDNTRNIISFVRKGDNPNEALLIVANFSPNVYSGYRAGVPFAGTWTPVLNSDEAIYGGSGVSDHSAIHSEKLERNGRADSIGITLPPLGVVIYRGTRHVLSVSVSVNVEDAKVIEDETPGSHSLQGALSKNDRSSSDNRGVASVPVLSNLSVGLLLTANTSEAAAYGLHVVSSIATGLAVIGVIGLIVTAVVIFRQLFFASANTKRGPPEVTVTTPEEFAATAATQVGARIVELQKSLHRNVNLVLATGNTMTNFLHTLAENKQIIWHRVNIYHLDEYRGVTREQKQSFAHYLNSHFLSRVRIPSQNIHFVIDANRLDPFMNSRLPLWMVRSILSPVYSATVLPVSLYLYMRQLKNNGGADVIMLGMGMNGHLAFNERFGRIKGFVVYQIIDRLMAMRPVKVSAETIKANLNDHPMIARIPFAVSMGMNAIVNSGAHLYFLVNGVRKAAVLKEVLNGPITDRTPASRLRTAPNVHFVFDTDAAGVSEVVLLTAANFTEPSAVKIPLSYGESTTADVRVAKELSDQAGELLRFVLTLNPSLHETLKENVSYPYICGLATVFLKALIEARFGSQVMVQAQKGSWKGDSSYLHVWLNVTIPQTSESFYVSLTDGQLMKIHDGKMSGYPQPVTVRDMRRNMALKQFNRFYADAGLDFIRFAQINNGFAPQSVFDHVEVFDTTHLEDQLMFYFSELNVRLQDRAARWVNQQGDRVWAAVVFNPMPGILDAVQLLENVKLDSPSEKNIISRRKFLAGLAGVSAGLIGLKAIQMIATRRSFERTAHNILTPNNREAMRLAGDIYKLHPSLIAAFILEEQEHLTQESSLAYLSEQVAEDITSRVGLATVGLGQVKVSDVMASKDFYKALIASKEWILALTDNDNDKELLNNFVGAIENRSTSSRARAGVYLYGPAALKMDIVNILATALTIRQKADILAKRADNLLPETARLKGHSSKWMSEKGMIIPGAKQTSDSAVLKKLDAYRGLFGNTYPDTFLYFLVAKQYLGAELALKRAQRKVDIYQKLLTAGFSTKSNSIKAWIPVALIGTASLLAPEAKASEVMATMDAAVFSVSVTLTFTFVGSIIGILWKFRDDIEEFFLRDLHSESTPDEDISVRLQPRIMNVFVESKDQDKSRVHSFEFITADVETSLVQSLQSKIGSLVLEIHPMTDVFITRNANGFVVIQFNIDLKDTAVLTILAVIENLRQMLHEEYGIRSLEENDLNHSDRTLKSAVSGFETVRGIHELPILLRKTENTYGEIIHVSRTHVLEARRLLKEIILLSKIRMVHLANRFGFTVTVDRKLQTVDRLRHHQGYLGKSDD
jgi:1,4-alpha-glucan branching enzyme